MNKKAFADNDIIELHWKNYVNFITTSQTTKIMVKILFTSCIGHAFP